MAQFKHPIFSFDGLRGDEHFQLYLINHEDSMGEKQFGVSRSLTTSLSPNGSNMIVSVDEESPTFTMRFVKADQNMNPIPITEDDMLKINKWLFGKKDYAPFISYDNKDLVYYGMFLNGTMYQNGAGHGYLTVEFQLDSSHAYGTLQHVVKQVIGYDEFEILVKNNVDDYTYPDFEFIVDEGQEGFEVENLNTGEKMEFFRLDEDSRHGYVYNDGLKHVVSLSNPSINMRERSNKQFIRLIYGKNRIKIYGNGKFIFYIQPKIAIQ